jgi:hypothetical protein
MTRYLEIKPGSISETIKRLSDDYQAIFKAELEKTGKGIGSMTPDEKKAFFNKIDKMHNAKNEEIKPKKPEDSKTVMVVKPNAPAGQEKVIRVPKEKLADYKSKGYVEAESYMPEAKKVKEEELTAGQKKLPPALQKAIEKKQKNEEAEITETEGGSGGGIDALRAIKGKRQRLQQELDALNKDDTNYKEKAANLRGQIEKQKEIMASKQKEVYGSYDPSREDALDLNEITDEEVETVEEAAGADQLTNLNDKITRMQMNLSKLDMTKPESKTKEAIIKSDLTTAKLRLQDLMQKRNKETEKPMSEAKKTYKSMKKSVKKEEETPKKTMTDKQLTKIDVDPKLPTH